MRARSCARSTAINDVFGCSNDLLLNQILSGTFGFNGFVMTDFGAVALHQRHDLRPRHGQPGNLNGGRFSVSQA